MPTYDYVCKFCEHTFEHFQGIHDALLKKCPECGRRGLERQFGIGAGVVFKGSGFYETDYKRKGQGQGQGQGQDTKKETSRSGDPSGDKNGDGKASPSKKSSGEDSTVKPAAKADKPGKAEGGDKKPSSQKSDD